MNSKKPEGQTLVEKCLKKEMPIGSYIDCHVSRSQHDENSFMSVCRKLQSKGQYAPSCDDKPHADPFNDQAVDGYFQRKWIKILEQCPSRTNNEQENPSFTTTVQTVPILSTKVEKQIQTPSEKTTPNPLTTEKI